MTKPEFLKGWDLLTAQPWGKRYATVSDKSTATTAATQLAFYFKKLEKFPADMWMVECELFAAGDHWPSVDELRTAGNNALPKERRIEYHHQRAEMPEAIGRSLAYAEAHNVSFLEGMQAVLPDWCKENRGHWDFHLASVLYDKIKTMKPSGLLRTTSAFKF